MQKDYIGNNDLIVVITNKELQNVFDINRFVNTKKQVVLRI